MMSPASDFLYLIPTGIVPRNEACEVSRPYPHPPPSTLKVIFREATAFHFRWPTGHDFQPTACSKSTLILTPILPSAPSDERPLLTLSISLLIPFTVCPFLIELACFSRTGSRPGSSSSLTFSSNTGAPYRMPFSRVRRNAFSVSLITWASAGGIADLNIGKRADVDGLELMRRPRFGSTGGSKVELRYVFAQVSVPTTRRETAALFTGNGNSDSFRTPEHSSNHGSFRAE